DGFELLAPVRRHDHRDMLADDLAGLVAVEVLGPGVPADDRPVEALADDGVVSRVDDSGEKAKQLPADPGIERLVGHATRKATASRDVDTEEGEGGQGEHARRSDGDDTLLH